MYAFGSVVPLFVFAWLGPLVRKKCPKGFTLTHLNSLTGVDIYAPVISIAVVATIYTGTYFNLKKKKNYFPFFFPS